MKQAELEAWEKRLKEREASIEAASTGTNGPDNWPSCYPIARNDIENDFPEGSRHQELITYGYRIFLADCLLFFWNFICACAYASGSSANGSKAETVLMSMAFILFGIPVQTHKSLSLTVHNQS